MPHAPYDIAIVLGAALREDGSPPPAMLRRVAHGVTLHRHGVAARLLMSGGRVRGPLPEAWVMRDLALRAGIAEEHLLIEDASRDTVDNVRLCLRLLAGTDWGRLVVVSDATHLPRALWTFRRYGVAVAGSAPEPPTSSPLWPARLREACAFPLTVWKVARRPLVEKTPRMP